MDETEIIIQTTYLGFDCCHRPRLIALTNHGRILEYQYEGIPCWEVSSEYNKPMPE